MSTISKEKGFKYIPTDGTELQVWDWRWKFEASTVDVSA